MTKSHTEIDFCFLILRGSLGKEIFLVKSQDGKDTLSDFLEGKDFLSFTSYNEKDLDDIRQVSKKTTTVFHVETRQETP